MLVIKHCFLSFFNIASLVSRCALSLYMLGTNYNSDNAIQSLLDGLFKLQSVFMGQTIFFVVKDGAVVRLVGNGRQFFHGAPSCSLACANRCRPLVLWS